MPNNIIQAQIAFKNLLGKSQTSPNLGVGNESNGYFFNVPSTNIWSSQIPENNPTSAVDKQIGVQILADLVLITDSALSGQYAAYQAVWGATPSGKDPRTNLDYEFGKGTLTNASKYSGSGIPTTSNKVRDIIPSSYGFNYEIRPYITYPTSEISGGDTRDWVFQYSSGIFYQSSVTHAGYSAPTKLTGYYYTGNKLSSLDSTGPEIIRLSATGPSGSAYFATQSSPSISTYSVNHLYLVDFFNPNTQSAQLNITNIGTFSIYKYGSNGPIDLTSGDIQGATGSTAGPIYYLTYNSDNYFQLFESNPSQTPGLYKNEADVINTVGGISKGFSFNDVTIQDMFTNLLYPELLGNYTSLSISHQNVIPSSLSNIGLIDVGRSLTGTITFSWTGINSLSMNSTVNIVDNTEVPIPTINWPAKSVSPKGFSFDSYTGTFSYTYSVVSNVPDKRVFQLRSSRTNKTNIRPSSEIQWTWRGYYGNSTYSTLSPSGVTALSSSLMTQSLGTLNISGTQGYKYLAFPDGVTYSFRNITYYNLPVPLATQSYTLVDGYGNNYTTMTVTNSYNKSTTYRVYRTLNEFSGTLSINLSN